MKMNPATHGFWQAFLQSNALPPDPPCKEVFHFGGSPAAGNKLLALVPAGKKRATTCSLWPYSLAGEALPRTGDYSVVTSGSNTPGCTIQTTAVITLPL